MVGSKRTRSKATATDPCLPPHGCLVESQTAHVAAPQHGFMAKTSSQLPKLVARTTQPPAAVPQHDPTASTALQSQALAAGTQQ
ncbi:unnamed protein product [Prunus armeniaca]